MSELLHPGHHPDADQLSAFVEHALPEHERLITLAHLADCSDCRQIVFLAQQATGDENPTPHATSSRKPTFSFRGWNLLWPAAAAVSCVLLIMVFTHGRKPAEQSQETVVASKPPTPVPPLQTSTPQLSDVARMTSPKPLAKKTLSPANPQAASPQVTKGAITPAEGDLVSSDQTLSNLSLRGHNIFSPAPQPTDANHISAASTHGAIGGMALQAQAGPSRIDHLATSNLAQKAGLPSQNQMLPQRVATLSSPSPTPLAQRFISPNTSQAIAVIGATPTIQTENAVFTAGVLDSATPSSQALPSHSLPGKGLTTSSVSNGSQTLAVDSEGDLFLSKDAGVNWQHITQQWIGRAIKVALSSPAATTQPDSGNAGLKGTATLAVGSSPSSAKKAGFELTTATGTIWFSPDGFIWEKR